MISNMNVAWLKCKPAPGGDTIAFLTSVRQERLSGRYLTAMWDTVPGPVKFK
ncbi:hypothetical protein F5Y18DRAFT_378805 [Xylariaceae sp. FL1019]|nr:hypothetical protein F5Y18DRAFT_378805 [Xylariaceae sp. FL1019]